MKKILSGKLFLGVILIVTMLMNTVAFYAADTVKDPTVTPVLTLTQKGEILQKTQGNAFIQYEISSPNKITFVGYCYSTKEEYTIDDKALFTQVFDPKEIPIFFNATYAVLVIDEFGNYAVQQITIGNIEKPEKKPIIWG